MKNALLKPFVLTLFWLKKREGISAEIREILGQYLGLAEELGAEGGAKCVRVPAMLGVDEDMREWSLYMILEHNVIVNRVMRLTVRSLAHDKEPRGMEEFNVKTDVMPSPSPGVEQVAAFRESVDGYLAMVEKLPALRGTRKFRHPIFGPLDAHGWHGMFALHLRIHLNQARALRRQLSR